MGREMGGGPDYSGQVAAQIDAEVRNLLDEAHDEALEILVENDHVLEALAAKLLEVETVDGELMKEVFAPIDKRPTRAVLAPVEQDPKNIIDQLRRLDPSLQHRNGNGSGHGDGSGNGAEATPRKRTRKTTSSAAKPATKRSTSTRRRATED
jgi:cell division protease FtsH